ncbi:MAG: M56 family metallopeptidase [Verrucomicrobiota bacterium]
MNMTIGTILLGGALLLGLAFAGSLLLRSGSGSLTRAYWSMVMVCVVGMPVFEMVLPDVALVPVDSRMSGMVDRPAAPDAVHVMDSGRVMGEALEQRVALDVEAVSYFVEGSTGEFTEVRGDGRGDAVQEGADWKWLGVRELLIWGWLAGMVVIAGRLLVGWFVLARIWKGGVEPDAEWRSGYEALGRELGIGRAVGVRFSSRARVPMVWGVLRPRLVLPPAVRTWGDGERRALMVHELGHVRHGDALILLLAQVALVVHWVNPLMWLAVRRLRVAQERACDDLVLRVAEGGAPEYAAMLVRIAQGERGRLASSLAMTMAQRSTLKRRIGAILDPKMKRHPARLRHSLGMLVPLLMVTVVLSGTGWGEGKDTGTGVSGREDAGGEFGQALEIDSSAEAASEDDMEMDPFAGEGAGETWGIEAVNEKIERIVIPEIEFRNTPLEEVVTYLNAASVQHDLAGMGVNIILLREAQQRIAAADDRWDEQLTEALQRTERAREEYLELAEEAARSGHGVMREWTEARAKQIVADRQELERLRQEDGALDDLDAETLGEYYTAQGAQENQLGRMVRLLKEMQLRREKMGQQYSSGHPEVVKSEREMKALYEAIAEEAAKDGERRRRAIGEAEANLANLEAEHQEMQARAFAVSDESELGLKLNELKRRYERALTSFEMLEERAVQVRADSGAVADAPTITIALRQVPLGEVIKYVAQLGGLVMEVQPYAVVLGTVEEVEALRGRSALKSGAAPAGGVSGRGLFRDARGGGGAESAKVFTLQHTRAEDVLTILVDVLSDSGSKGATIVAVEETNDLVVRGAESDLLFVERILKVVDAQPESHYWSRLPSRYVTAATRGAIPPISVSEKAEAPHGCLTGPLEMEGFGDAPVYVFFERGSVGVEETGIPTDAQMKLWNEIKKRTGDVGPKVRRAIQEEMAGEEDVSKFDVFEGVVIILYEEEEEGGEAAWEVVIHDEEGIAGSDYHVEMEGFEPGRVSAAW